VNTGGIDTHPAHLSAVGTGVKSAVSDCDLAIPKSIICSRIALFVYHYVTRLQNPISVELVESYKKHIESAEKKGFDETIENLSNSIDQLLKYYKEQIEVRAE